MSVAEFISPVIWNVENGGMSLWEGKSVYQNDFGGYKPLSRFQHCSEMCALLLQNNRYEVLYNQMITCRGIRQAARWMNRHATPRRYLVFLLHVLRFQVS